MPARVIKGDRSLKESPGGKFSITRKELRVFLGLGWLRGGLRREMVEEPVKREWKRGPSEPSCLLKFWRASWREESETPGESFSL